MPNPGGASGVAEQTNSLQNLLSTSVQNEVARTQVWGQFPWIPEDGIISSPKGGQTVDLRFRQNLSMRTGTINEKADIDPEQVLDNVVSVTIDEYGHVAQTTALAEIVVRGDLRAEISELLSENMVASLDRKAGRSYYEGNQLVFRANGVAARVDLDTANDALQDTAVGMSFLARATAALRGAKVPGFASNNGGQATYATVIHTALAQDLPDTSGYLSALQNQDGRETLFNGEMGDIRGLRFMESDQGKVYLGAGDAAQSATTLSSSVSAGDVTVVVASATGLVAGDIITIGVVEATAVTTEAEDVENVLITNVASTTLTVVGLGYVGGDAGLAGLRYDHASGVSVIEADLVAAIPVFGPRSVMKAYAAQVGPFGESRVTGPFDRLGRFVNLGWYALQGWAPARRLYTVRMEVATAQQHIAINE